MNKSKSEKKDEELIELGKKLQQFYDMGYVSRRQALSFSFAKGMLGGAGAFIGGTLVIGIILWLLSLLDHVPVLETLIRNIQNNLQK